MNKICILLTVIFIIIISGCAKKETSVQDPIQEVYAGQTFEHGSYQETDANKDGKAEKAILILPKKELTTNLFVQEKLTLDEKKGRVDFQFSNIGDFSDYDFIVDIPKEFADSVDKVKFSIEPDEIIDKDPKVKYKVRANRSYPDFFYEFVFITSFDQFNLPNLAQAMVVSECVAKYERDDANLCVFDVAVTQYYARFEDTCDVIQRTYMDGILYSACMAVVKDELGECGELRDEAKAELCKGLAIESTCNLLKDKAEMQTCIYEKAKNSKSFMGCALIEDEDVKNLCLAKISGDDKYCKKINDDDLKKDCEAKEPDVCGKIGTPCCECYTCDAGLTCDTTSVYEICVKCGAEGQPPCLKCGGFNELGTTCCLSKPDVKPCDSWLSACAVKYGEDILCRTCGCSEQHCCKGECYGPGDGCHRDYCVDWHCTSGMSSCETNEDCCMFRRCKEGMCHVWCYDDKDCTDFGGGKCKNGFCD